MRINPLRKGKQSPKIAFFIIDYSFGGGVERVTADLARLFLDYQLNVTHLVSLFQTNKKPAITYDERLKIEVLAPKSKTKIIQHLKVFFQKEKPDFFIFQGDNMTIAKAILKSAKDCKVKAIPQYHGSPYAYLRKYADAENLNLVKRLLANGVFPFKKNKLKSVVEQSENGFVCVSEGVANELRNLFPNSEKCQKNITVIRNPIFVGENFNPQQKEKSISFVSRLESKHKNAFLILKSWEIIASEFPDWTLNIFGTGSLEEKMKDFCKVKRIENVKFHGFVSGIYSHLSASSISISTSNCEGFSMGIAEAMVNKNAIAITESDGGISDLIIHNKTGLISPKNDASALAKNIKMLITRQELRSQLSQKAYEHIVQLKNIDILDEWMKIIEGELLH